MGYLFLSLALIAGITKGFCGKKTSFAIKSTSDSMVMNAFRMVLCIAIGFFLVLIDQGAAALKVSGTVLLISALSGIFSATFVISWLLSVRTGAYMMVEIFLLLGTTVSVALCYLLFHETVTLWQMAGILLLFLAVYIMCTYNKSVKGALTPKALLLLILCGVSNGIADFSQKLLVKQPDGNVLVFNFYTYVFAAIFLFIVYLFFRRKEDPRPPAAVLKPIWLYIVIMAFCLFANSLFKTQAALYLDAVLLYPLNQGCAVLLSLLMSALLFKEKVTGKCLIGIALSFVALLMINLL